MKTLKICVHDDVKVEDVVVSKNDKKWDNAPIVFVMPKEFFFVSPDSTWAPTRARSPSTTTGYPFNVQSRTAV